MKKSKVQITSKGIKWALNRWDFSQAVCEYIWNGFDAKATEINISYKANEIGTLDELTITDNGYGIPFESLEVKFRPFFESEKLDLEKEYNTSTLHGRNGVGRLTFFVFSDQARWETAYKKDSLVRKYTIGIKGVNLEDYETSAPEAISTNRTGTKVTFSHLRVNQGDFTGKVMPFLQKEFCWFLELNPKFSIKVNSVPLEYKTDLIGDSEDFEVVHSESRTKFSIRYVQWKEKINKEYSKYYYINSSQQERFKENTTLNNKGDEFYHSLFIQSHYFDSFDFSDAQHEEQVALFSGTKKDDEFKYLKEELGKFLKKKRRPFLSQHANKLIQEYDREGNLPKFKENPWDQLRSQELRSLIKSLYKIEPRIFSSLNNEQVKSFSYLLNLILDSSERDGLIEIIQNIVELSSDERRELKNLLQKNHLSQIIKMIKLVQDRFKVIEKLKEITSENWKNTTLEADLQSIVEENYWIFGEEYHLLTSAEPDFNEALKRFTYLLTGERTEREIDHPDKRKQMDIFMCRISRSINQIESVVVELKRPSIRLGSKEFNQVITYLSVIREQPEFNGKNQFWKFYLVGNDFDTSGYIPGMINSTKSNGKDFLAYTNNQCEFYVKKWSEIFTEVDWRLNFLKERLEQRKQNIIETHGNQFPEEILITSDIPLATQPKTKRKILVETKEKKVF